MPFFPKNYSVSILFQTLPKWPLPKKREKWQLASQRLRAKKLVLDTEGWREHERLRVAEMRQRNGPLTEEQRLSRNDASRLGMQDLRERCAQPLRHMVMQQEAT